MDRQKEFDTTAWSMHVKRADFPDAWFVEGEFTNLFLDKAFKKLPSKEKKAAIEAVKTQLWYAFQKCYGRKI